MDNRSAVGSAVRYCTRSFAFLDKPRWTGMQCRRLWASRNQVSVHSLCGQEDCLWSSSWLCAFLLWCNWWCFETEDDPSLLLSSSRPNGNLWCWVVWLLCMGGNDYFPPCVTFDEQFWTEKLLPKLLTFYAISALPYLQEKRRPSVASSLISKEAIPYGCSSFWGYGGERTWANMYM